MDREAGTEASVKNKPNKNKQLEKAIQIAVSAHRGQFDRGGKPYILHPLHLMNQLMFDIELATIAVLHDVIEDSDITLEHLEEEGFSERVCTALTYLTHKSGQSYEDYISDIAQNYDAIRVKRKDLEHNSDITRLKGVKEKDLLRMKRYHKAFVLLSKAKAEFLAREEDARKE
ncbi:hypothetical protein [Alkalimarinus alittae]|uniref:GTP pyrophosphokinase n=1 Tax=Alkalimarinus alittae TaxID=2961619 RepID=A0ABY6N5L2_9ALTE|nr:hypothetical protein [Alkalimarinus alittae]UZE97277.1 hypothetical protein NKI27_05870 [Alkalimarinus alittae]